MIYHIIIVVAAVAFLPVVVLFLLAVAFVELFKLAELQLSFGGNKRARDIEKWKAS